MKPVELRFPQAIFIRAIVEREPRALNLDHQSMPRQKGMVQMWQRNRVSQRLIGLERFRFVVALTIASPEDVSANHELMTGHLDGTASLCPHRN